MLDRVILYKFIFIILIATAIVFSGCGKSKDPYVQFTPDQDTQIRTIGDKETDIEAVKMYVEAMMLNDIEKWDDAIQKLNAAVKYAPDFSLAFSFRGDVYQNTNQFAMSADSYEEATKIDPWSFKDFSNLGKVCQIIKEFSRAVKAYVSACQLKPDNFDVHLGAGQCYYELEDYELAFDYTQRAKEIKPEMGNVEVLLGDIYVEKDDLTEAVASYKRALEIDGNKPETMVSLAVVYTKQGLYAFAEELLTAAIEIDANSSTAFQYLGFVQLYLYKNNLDLALGSYKKAAQIDEKDWMARKGLGVVYMLMYMKDKDETTKQKALDQWDVSLAIKSDQPELKKLYKQCTGQ